MKRVLEVARSLAAKSPLALAAAKASVNRALQGDVEDGLAAEADTFAALFASEDQKEGMRAFSEKRQPRFSGR
jgi:enoyl-CoA hydratase/carnithine racemase